MQRIEQGMLAQPMTQMATVATTSGANVDVTGIPSWAKRIKVNIAALSTTGTSPPVLRLGTSGGVQTSGYACINSVVVSSAVTISEASGFLIGVNTTNWSSGVVISGSIELNLVDAATGLWAVTGMLAGSGAMYLTAGSKGLSGVLDRIRLTTVGGTDTFDAGSLSVTYEG